MSQQARGDVDPAGWRSLAPFSVLSLQGLRSLACDACSLTTPANININCNIHDNKEEEKKKKKK